MALWPGSCLHAVRAFENPRWEDFKYEYVDGYDEEGTKKKRQNRFFWLGDGSTWNEMHEGTNREEISFPSSSCHLGNGYREVGWFIDC